MRRTPAWKLQERRYQPSANFAAEWAEILADAARAREEMDAQPLPATPGEQPACNATPPSTFPAGERPAV